jgi:hypothetical protein
MNHKLPLAAITFCVIAIISFYSFPARGDISNQFASTPMAFTPTTRFAIPATNGSISFAQTGYYENATLVNDTWVFNQLQLGSTAANLNVTAQDSNITLTSFEHLLSPDCNDINNTGSWLTPGWLNYTVAGVGRQVIQMQFEVLNWNSPFNPQMWVGTSTWPIGVQVYIDGEEVPYNTSWTTVSDDNGIIPYGTGVIVNGAASNVSISYEWAPVPSPVNQLPADSNLQTTEDSAPSSWMPYLLIIALASGVIVPAALFTNRHRLKSMLSERTKRKKTWRLKEHAETS